MTIPHMKVPLKMQFRTQKCPQNVTPRAKVPFSLKQHRGLFQSWAEHWTHVFSSRYLEPCWTNRH